MRVDNVETIIPEPLSKATAVSVIEEKVAVFLQSQICAYGKALLLSVLTDAVFKTTALLTE
jgi:hypothetical protein